MVINEYHAAEALRSYTGPHVVLWALKLLVVDPTTAQAALADAKVIIVCEMSFLSPG